MARPSKEPPISSTIVPSIAKLLGARGLDVRALALRFDLPEDAPSRGSVLVAGDVPNELLEIAERAEKGAVTALANGLTGRVHTLAEVAVRGSATIMEALERQARWTALLHEGLRASVTRGESTIRFVVQTPHRPRGVGRHVHELALALAVARIARASDSEVVPVRVWFSHARPRDPIAFGACPIEYGRDDSGFELAAPLPEMKHGDEETASAVAAMVDAMLAPAPDTFAERVRAYVASQLPNEVDVEAVARAMHMSARTLQRRLEGEGTQLSELASRARRDVAEKLLADAAIPLAEVAARAGFSELATFSRAFKRWTGMPPGQWRRS